MTKQNQKDAKLRSEIEAIWFKIAEKRKLMLLRMDELSTGNQGQSHIWNVEMHSHRILVNEYASIMDDLHAVIGMIELPKEMIIDVPDEIMDKLEVYGE